MNRPVWQRVSVEMGHSLRLAVIIPSYNYERYVGRAIDSVVLQNREDVEIVVVDDGSSDGSWNVIRSREGVRAVAVSNVGQLRACLKGLSLTTAPFVLFLDSDDELAPGALDVIMPHLDAGVAKLQFSLGLIDADGVRIGPAQPTLADYRDREKLIQQVIRTGVYLTPPTSGNVFRRDVCDLLNEVDYDRSVDGAVLYAAPFFGEVVSLSQELGYYRIHGRNFSNRGGVPTLASLEAELLRFETAMLHLGRVVRRLDRELGFGDPRDLFVYRERSFCRTIASGERPPPARLPGLLLSLARYVMPAESKVALALFFILASVTPARCAKALLAYRFKADGRSAFGFLRIVMGLGFIKFSEQ